MFEMAGLVPAYLEEKVKSVVRRRRRVSGHWQLGHLAEFSSSVVLPHAECTRNLAEDNCTAVCQLIKPCVLHIQQSCCREGDEERV